MSHSKSKSKQPNLVADELVLDEAGNTGLYGDHKRMAEAFIKDIKEGWQKRNQYNQGAACIYNLFHHGLNGIRPMKTINDPEDGGSGATERWGREGSEHCIKVSGDFPGGSVTDLHVLHSWVGGRGEPGSGMKHIAVEGVGTYA